MTNVENVLEAAIEAQNLHCLGSVSDSFALALVEVPGALSLAIFSAPIEYLKLGCQLQSPTIFREAYAHVVGRWINPNDTIRDSVLPRDIVKLIRNEKKRTLDLYAVVRSKLIELQRVGPCQMTAVREVLRRHVAKARSAYGMQGQEGARCLAFAREPIILRSEVTRYERHKVHRDKRPRKRDLSKSTPGHFLSSSTESGSSDSSAGFPPTLQQAVAEHLLEIRQVLKPLLINQTNLRNGARDIDWSLSLDAEGLTAKGWPATEDGNRDADRSWLKPPDLWVAKNGRSVSIRYLLCAKIDDVDLPWIGVER